MQAKAHSIEASVPPHTRLSSLHRLRGFAAMCVVFGHAFNLTALRSAQDVVPEIFVLISSATIYFVLIGGMLFQMKAIPRFKAGKINTRKILGARWAEIGRFYVLVGSILALLITLNDLQRGTREFGEVGFYLLMLTNGSMAQSYWYVPFFLVLMALSPLHIKFSDFPLTVRAILVLMGVAMAIIIHRPTGATFYAPLHSLLYYLPLFWFGMIVGSCWSIMRGFLVTLTGPLLVAWVSIGAAQVFLGQTHVILEDALTLGVFDLFPIQKIVGFLFFLSLFERVKDFKMPLLDWLGRYSLMIFFLHPLIMIGLNLVPHVSGFFAPELIATTLIAIFLSQKIGVALAGSSNGALLSIPK